MLLLIHSRVSMMAFNRGELKPVKKFDIDEFNAEAKAELDSLFE